MALPAETLSLSYDEYLALEEETGLRHEYLRGEVWAMAGGTPQHSAVTSNLHGELYVALKGKPCRVYNGDLKTRVDATDLSTYPDLAVVCGELQRSLRDRNAGTNPTVLFEVLSPSTEAWDRGGKFRHYRHLETLQHYVLVGVTTRVVEVFSRNAEGDWVLREVGEGGRLTLSAIGVEIDVDALYVDIPVDPADVEGAPDPEAAAG